VLYASAVEIPEARQVAALQRVADLGRQRKDLLAQVEHVMEHLREACVDAARTGATRSRIRELAEVSTSTLYPWLADAEGVTVRPTRPKGR